jgi:hypothetical protein
MPLRSARLTGDPVLTQCLEGTHRMVAGEDGLSVMRLQSGLIDLGFSVGPDGADGRFGPNTGAAVTAYKTRKGLVPNDPVVGKGTAQALDDDLFRAPPELDPTFAEFAPAVVEHRLEQFVARELIGMLRAPLDSWRHMLARSALDMLNSGLLLGIVARSRADDLSDVYFTVADATQPDGSSAAAYFNDAVTTAAGQGVTVEVLSGGALRAMIILDDDVVLGRAVTFHAASGRTAPEPLIGVLVHELTHARNLDRSAAIAAAPDDDTATFADTALAAQRSATGTPSAESARTYVDEIVARHVHWVVRQEVAGTPGGIAVRFLPPDQLAAAALFYVTEEPFLWDVNGYGAGVNAQGDAVRYPQLDLWLRLCASQVFSDSQPDDQASTDVFLAAAQWCADQVVDPVLDFPRENGVFPLPSDFS